jgi:hypothetical protein
MKKANTIHNWSQILLLVTKRGIHSIHTVCLFQRELKNKLTMLHIRLTFIGIKTGWAPKQLNPWKIFFGSPAGPWRKNVKLCPWFRVSITCVLLYIYGHVALGHFLGHLCITILHTPCLFTFQLLIVIEVIYNTYTIKPAQAVTFFLSCHRQFHMNSTSFKRSSVL